MSFSALADLAGLSARPWENQLRADCSFRGVKFRAGGHGGQVGRRLDIKERPLNDEPLIQDLGRGIRKYTITAHVVGDDYMPARDALVAAMERKDVPGTLVHPWLGEMLVWPDSCAYRETAAEGGICRFELGFLVARAAPAVKQDATLLALQQLRRVLTTARTVAALALSQRNLGSFLLAAGGNYLAGIAQQTAGFLGVPGLNLLALSSAQTALGAQALGDSAGVAAAVVAPYAAVADAVSAVPSGYIASGGAAAGQGTTTTTSRAETSLPAGWAIGPLLQAAWPAPVAFDAEAQMMANTLAMLSADAACCAAIQVALYAAWLDAKAAAAARDALADALRSRADAAADAEADDLYAAWRSLETQTLQAFDTQLQVLPVQRRYALAGSVPSLVLAHRLMQDAGRADELVGANGVPHPALMPAAGVWWP